MGSAELRRPEELRPCKADHLREGGRAEVGVLRERHSDEVRGLHELGSLEAGGLLERGTIEPDELRERRITKYTLRRECSLPVVRPRKDKLSEIGNPFSGCAENSFELSLKRRVDLFFDLSGIARMH